MTLDGNGINDRYYLTFRVSREVAAVKRKNSGEQVEPAALETEGCATRATGQFSVDFTESELGDHT